MHPTDPPQYPPRSSWWLALPPASCGGYPGAAGAAGAAAVASGGVNFSEGVGPAAAAFCSLLLFACEIWIYLYIIFLCLPSHEAITLRRSSLNSRAIRMIICRGQCAYPSYHQP